MYRLKGGDWPPYSPDLNPVEQIWPIVTRALDKQIFSTKEDLWSSLDAAFKTVTKEQVLRLYGSMQRRLAAEIAANGANTKY